MNESEKKAHVKRLVKLVKLVNKNRKDWDKDDVATFERVKEKRLATG